MNKECEHCLYRDWYCPVCIYYADDEEESEYDDIYNDLDGLDIDDIM